MDSDALLADIRRYTEQYLTHEYVESARDLAQTVALLDTWLSRGGPLPSEWAAAVAS